MSGIKITSSTDIVQSDHYAILTFGSIYIPDEPGDERSRTHPGHGYPASPGYSKAITYYEVYTDKAAWVSDIVRLATENKSFVPIVAKVPRVTTTTTVENI